MALTHQQLKDALSLLTEDEKLEVLRGTIESVPDPVGPRMVAEEWTLEDALANDLAPVVEMSVEALYPIAIEAVS
jgi:hypothetical protein